MGFLVRFRENWKQNYAAIVVYGYFYDILLWPLLFWGSTIGTSVTGSQWPGPPLVPWEQLAVATANLAVIGGIELMKTRESNKQGTSTTSTVEASVETTTVQKG